MVYRIYVEKKDGFDHEAKSLLSDARELLSFRVSSTSASSTVTTRRTLKNRSLTPA